MPNPSRKRGGAKQTARSRSRSNYALPIAVAFIGVIGAVLAAGPDTVMDRTKAAFGVYAPPQILRAVRERDTHNGPLVVTVLNPSHEEVAITGYHVEPVPSSANAMSSDGGGEVAQVVAQDVPAGCAAGRRDVRLPRTVAIQPKRIIDLVIHPWLPQDSCSFELTFQTSHGDSTTHAVWELNIEKLEELLKDVRRPPVPPPPAPE